jgi:hypothetical protein
MGSFAGPEIVTDGLVFAYDMGNPDKSWIGQPTINTVNAISTAILTYNNPGFSGTSTNTGLTYRGMPIYELTFIPQDASFIPRLASGEGFGAFHPMGTSLAANTRYMASIYMRSDHPLQSSASQGFNNTYSNISGWGANSTTSARYQEDGWTRLYTQYYNNTNGYSTRNIAYPNQYGNGTQFTVNTTQTTTVDLSVTLLANGTGIPDFAALYAIVAAAPTITVNGGLTGLTILDHGLNTTSFTKLSWPSNIKLKADLPFTYFFRVSVPSTGGTNVNISIASNFTTYLTSLSDNKFWKLTFDTTNVAVGQILKTYWCAPMIEQHNTLYPSTFVNGTRSNTQALLDLTNRNTITASSLTYASDGTFSFNGSSNDIAISGPVSSFFTDFSQQITLSAWIRIPAAATWTNGFAGNILSRSSYAGSVGLWRDTVNNQILAYFRQAGATFGAVACTGTIGRDVWVNIVASWTGSSLSLYLNGVLSQTNTGTLGGANIANWTIGNVTAAGGNVGNRFQGEVGITQIYDRALTATEVQQNFNALRGRYGI